MLVSDDERDAYLASMAQVVWVQKEKEVQLLVGDPSKVLGITKEELSKDELESRVVGLSPTLPWREECRLRLLLRSKEEVAICIAFESKDLGGGRMLVQAQREPLSSSSGWLVRLARLAQAGSLFGPIAHELNNQVQSLTSSAYLFDDCRQSGQAIDVEDVEDLRSSAACLQRLAASIQRVARSGCSQRQGSLADSLHRCLELLHSAGVTKIVNVEVEIENECQGVSWPPVALEFLLTALISNAADESLRQRSPTISLKLTQVGDHGRFEIHNTGELPRFDLEFGTSKNPLRHLGIGLFAAQVLAARVGGSLNLVKGRVVLSIPLDAGELGDEISEDLRS